MSEKCVLRFPVENPDGLCAANDGLTALDNEGVCDRCCNNVRSIFVAVMAASTMEQLDAFAEALKGKDLD